nr:isoprenyl transferase-like [Nerophis lumbriciformis]
MGSQFTVTVALSRSSWIVRFPTTAGGAMSDDEVLGLEAGPAVSNLWTLFKQQVKRPFYSLYLRRLRAQASSCANPSTLDSSWTATAGSLREVGLASPLWGHQRGADKLSEILEWCYHNDIRVVTVWCFSLENFQRSAAEVEGLLNLFEDKTREIRSDRQIRRAEEATAGYDSYQLNIAMAYGGREEITEAFRGYLEEQGRRGESLDSMIAGLDAEAIQPFLYTSGLPEPDLILRTSGELRSSGFLLWQSAYSEFYFCDTCWPAFREIDFLRALRSYHLRQRRYGR